MKALTPLVVSLIACSALAQDKAVTTTDYTRLAPEFDGCYVVTPAGQKEVKERPAESAKEMPAKGVARAIDFVYAPKCYYTLDGTPAATCTAEEFQGFIVQGAYDFKQLSLNRLTPKILGQDLSVINATMLPDKKGQPLFIAGKNIDLKRRAVGTNGYYCKPEAALAPGLYAVWIKNTFWVFSITDNKATPEKKP
jgi:hypothetical protein